MQQRHHNEFWELEAAMVEVKPRLGAHRSLNVTGRVPGWVEAAGASDSVSERLSV